MPEAPILMDTSVWIPYLRRGARPALIARVSPWIADKSVVMAGPILVEILGGVRRPDEFEALREDLQALLELELKPGFWIRSARLGSALRRSGLSVPAVDQMIAQIALDHDVTVAHADRHFETISRHTALQTVDLTALT